MPEKVEINIVEDDSVKKALRDSAANLEKRNNPNSGAVIRLRILKGVRDVFSILFNIFSMVVVGMCVLLCFSNINSRLQNVCPTFFGYSNLVVQTGSMVDSGLNIGDNVIVHSVDAHSLHPAKKDGSFLGDIIAFYEDYDGTFDINVCEKVREKDTLNEYQKYYYDYDTPVKFVTPIGTAFGFQSETIITAGRASKRLVIHHVQDMYVDTETGKYWFITKGSNNGAADALKISEDLVVGALDNSSAALKVASMMNFASSRAGVLLMLLPFMCLMLVIFGSYIKKQRIALLKYECVVGRRKISDPVCIVNKIGYKMDNRQKLKVIGRANPDDYNLFITLLWKEHERPENIMKYCTRKKMLLKYDKQILELKRECEQLIKNSGNTNKVVSYYIKTKEALLEKQRKLKKQMMQMAREYEDIRLSEGAEEEKTEEKPVSKEKAPRKTRQRSKTKKE